MNGGLWFADVFQLLEFEYNTHQTGDTTLLPMQTFHKFIEDCCTESRQQRMSEKDTDFRKVRRNVSLDRMFVNSCLLDSRSLLVSVGKFLTQNVRRILCLHSPCPHCVFSKSPMQMLLSTFYHCQKCFWSPLELRANKTQTFFVSFVLLC